MEKLYDSVRCRDEGRRAALLEAAAHGSTLNAIDTVEVEKNNQTTLHVFFLLGVPNGLNHHPELFTVTGGERVTNIQVLDTVQQGGADPHLDVLVNVAGDFSIYTLTIQSPALDPVFASMQFSFKVGCDSPFDCPGGLACVDVAEPDPLIDYNAKDYPSFRRALLDWISARYPGWLERSEADLGIALLDLFAYAADQLSDYQDRVSNEMFLETARQRLSVKRHSALIDYILHEGANAHTFLCFLAKADGNLPVRTPVQTQTVPGEAPLIFETDEPAALYADHNQFEIYTWSNADCCLPLGTTEVCLLGWYPHLQAGDYLLFKEAKSPLTGLEADADRTRRQVVRLTRVERGNDPLTSQDLTRVHWGSGDALTKQFCIATICADGSTLGGVSVACGNIVPASHGSTQQQPVNVPPAAPLEEICKPLPLPPAEPFSFVLEQAPLTFTTETGDPRDGHSTLEISIPPTDDWHERRTLVESGEFDQDFVVDVNEEGVATIRFGDGTYGRAVPPGASFQAIYRIGNGRAGNVGAETLTQFAASALIAAVTNPLPAAGGIDPESIADVKKLAPEAFHAVKLRAVTEQDYAEAAEKVPGVAHAGAHFRWTGSWYTVFVSIDPAGRVSLSDELKEAVFALLDTYRMAGYDLEIRPPLYVPLDIAINICVAGDYFRADVQKAVLDALSAGVLPDGRQGFFHPDRFSFGDPLYLSRLYQAVEQVEGVQSVQVTKFERWGHGDQGELDEGDIDMSEDEIVRLDNDPSEPEHGRLVLTMLEGK
ncbi:MAG TPA: putative baseplate assembly protein [Anaerolineales bacterium]|nr:putative baseplate assembly protein [Anaerolineales bacterium]